MNALTTDAASGIRLGVFLLVFLILALSEVRWPRRQLKSKRTQRWVANIGLSVINATAMRVLIPFAGVATALWAQQYDIGLFNQLGWPGQLELMLFVLLFDLTIYWQHRIFHMVPILWRFHRVHHTDEDYDLTTGSRFHPVSMLISAILKIGLVILLGPSVLAVLSAEILLNLTSMFNHSNIRLPLRIDKLLRNIFVTPDMHRIHHSQNSGEHNRNFGFNFSFWDKIFGSYTQNAEQSQEEMIIGINGFKGKATHKLLPLLIQPLQRGEFPNSKRNY